MKKKEKIIVVLARESFRDHARLKRHCKTLTDSNFRVFNVRLHSDEDALPNTEEVTPAHFRLTKNSSVFSHFLFRKMNWELEISALQKCILKLEPHFILACDPESLVIASKVKNKIKCRIVYDFQEYFEGMPFVDKNRYNWISKIYNNYGSNIDRSITITRSHQAIIYSKYKNIVMPEIVPNCGNKSLFLSKYDGRMHDAAGINKNRKIILFQGGFSIARGISNLFEVANKSRDFDIVFMGSGFLRNEIEKRCKNQKNIHIIDRVPESELQYWTSGAYFGTIPYEANGLNNTFCLPNKLWEYASCAVPVLARGLPELKNMEKEYKFPSCFPINGDSHDIIKLLHELEKHDYEELKKNAIDFYLKTNWSFYEQTFLDQFVDK